MLTCFGAAEELRRSLAAPDHCGSRVRGTPTRAASPAIDRLGVFRRACSRVQALRGPKLRRQGFGGQFAVAVFEEFGDFWPVDLRAKVKANQVGKPTGPKELTVRWAVLVELWVRSSERQHIGRTSRTRSLYVRGRPSLTDRNDVGEGVFADAPTGAHPGPLLIRLGQGKTNRTQLLQEFDRRVRVTPHEATLSPDAPHSGRASKEFGLLGGFATGYELAGELEEARLVPCGQQAGLLAPCGHAGCQAYTCEAQ
jgi:hypothetical protein